LALGYTTFRMVKIVCLSIFHAGRIDSPVLAKRASPVPFIGEFANAFASFSPCLFFLTKFHIIHYTAYIRLCCLGFLIDDTAPNFFIQDCLLHEAVCCYRFIYSSFYFTFSYQMLLFASFKRALTSSTTAPAPIH
jgi:hypothetical protein